ncbi:MAG: efflux RND transporter periplasmic adaptor subunit [Phycisphaerales bacterium]
MKKSSVIAAVIIFGLLGAVGGSLAFIKYRALTAGPQGPAWEPSESVEVVAARQISHQVMADLVGTVFSLRSVTVKNELAGSIRTIGFGSGAVVEQGSVLLTMDDSTEQADLKSAQAMVKVAQAAVAVGETRVALAGSEVARMEAAATDTRVVAPMDMDRARAELDSARADLARLKAEVDQALAKVEQVNTRIAKLTIRAPFRGRAGLRLVHEGQYLAEGDTIVMLEEVGDSIYLDFAIAQEYVGRVAVGAKVAGFSPVLGPDPFTLEVVAIDAMASLETRNIRVRSVLSNRSGLLRPGMFLQIRVPVDDPRPVVVIPSTAVRRASYADQVFLVVEGEKPGSLRAKQRFVKLGPAVGSDVIILEGVAAGDQIAATGSFKLHDGVGVTKASPKTSATPDAASATAPR